MNRLNKQFRIEKDSMNPVKVPKEAYYGAQTQRAMENFQISGWRFHEELTHALGLIKYASAKTNFSLGAPGGENRQGDREGLRRGNSGKMGQPVWDRYLPDWLRHLHQHECQ